MQGVSELFPVSSLGHAVIIPALLHWHIARNDPTFLAFIVVLHLGTALALVAFYRRDWGAIVAALWRSVAKGRMSDDRDERLGWLLIMGTIPVGVLGVLLEHSVRELFASTAAVAIFLIINGGLMFFGEALAARAAAQTRELSSLRFPEAAAVGFAQALALLPGISRSGCSIIAGLFLRLSHEDAARYAFLLATPVILAASLLEIPELFAPDVHLALVESVVGGVISAVTAYVSVAFLTRYFRHNSLRPFGWYCLGAGALTLTLSLLKVIA